MKRFIFVPVSVFVLQSLPAQEYKDFGKDRLNSSPRHGEWVDIKSGERTIKAFVVYPERKDKAPAVLVIQEIFGLTDWLRSMCDELAVFYCWFFFFVVFYGPGRWSIDAFIARNKAAPANTPGA